ncbi:MAG: hypothetical protein EOO68_33550 [Moraxellaceae bacterium]|nr:MAG: hypothetical protein EOO68_33550 [Moraxellaceae bacterium]
MRNFVGVSGLTVGGNLSYQSSIYWDELYGRGRVTQGGLTTIGLFASYQINQKASVSLNIENISDKFSRSFGGNGYSVNVLPRNAWIKLHYKI